MFFVYILQSVNTHKYYIGQTNNLEQRINRHNDKLVNSTKAFAPWKIIWSTEKSTRSEAMGLEKKLKNLSRVRIEEFILKYS